MGRSTHGMSGPFGQIFFRRLRYHGDMDWSPFAVCAPEEYAPPARGLGGPEGIADRLRTAAFAERQAFAAFLWAAESLPDASEELRAAWRRIGLEEELHL